MSRFIPYGRQSISEDDIKAVVEVLKSDFITQGPKAAEFEAALAGYCGAKYAVVFSSGTAALHGAYFAAGIGRGDEVVTSPLTFAATANAALYLGAHPVFVDIEPDTGNIDANLIGQVVTKKTKAIVPVHYAGHPADMDSVLEVAKASGLIVIEDACHAIGAEYRGKKIGSISDMTVFSFHPVKAITTGEGGAVLTDNADYYERMMVFRNHGVTKEAGRFENESHGGWYYEMQSLGYNYRMTDIHAALGIAQLKKLDSFIEARRSVAAFYNKEFAGNSHLDVPLEKGYASSAHHLYPIRLKDAAAGRKADIFSGLRKAGLGVQVHYMPVYLHPYYKRLGLQKTSRPVAEDFYMREISLPIYPGLGGEDMEYAAKTVLRAVG